MKGKQALARRYRYLWTGELVAAGGILLLFVLYVPLEEPWRNWVLRAYGLAIFLVLLVEGAFWWRGRLQDLKAGRRHPAMATLLVFARLRGVNWLLIGGFPVLVPWRGAASDPIPPTDLGWGIVLAVAAAIEQVNYFYYQLSYGYGLDFWYLRRHRRPRRGNVARHLEETRNQRARSYKEATRLDGGDNPPDHLDASAS